MLTKTKAKKVIKSTVKGSIIAFARRRLKSQPKFQVLDLLIPTERKIRSVVGGLETSLGTTLWEPLAKALATENGFSIIKQRLEWPTNMPANLNATLSSIIDERRRRSGIYNARQSHNEIKRVCQVFINRPIGSFEPAPKGRGVDIWLRKKGINYLFDTKTVQPNVGALTSCMEQLLHWYAYFYARYPKAKAQARIIFPYNPHNGDFWDSTIGKGLPLERGGEAWVENEFWDFCSGLKGTYQLIEEAFYELNAAKELEEELRRLFYNKTT